MDIKSEDHHKISLMSLIRQVRRYKGCFYDT